MADDFPWMEELSEDWIEPSGSDSSISLPSLAASTNSDNSQVRAPASRIPLSKNRRSSLLRAPNSNNNLPLGERSPSENNVPLSQRDSRRHLPNEIAQKLRGRGLSRTTSISSAGSVVHNTVQHKSQSNSATKASYKQDTPEWKRRIINGQVAYGEQVDLLTPGGLETLFKPPPPSQSSPTKRSSREVDDSDMMPSSPPPYATNTTQTASGGNGSQGQQHNKPRTMNYRMASDPEGSQLSFSEAELSQSSCFRPGVSVSQSASQQPTIQEDAEQSILQDSLQEQSDEPPQRTVSGQSEVRHEGLSPIYVSRHNTTDGGIDYAAIVNSSNGVTTQVRDKNVDEMASELLDSFHIDDDTSQMLPVDATTDTQDFAHNGRFVNLGRGGQSREGSFQHRMLSPSSMPRNCDSSIMQDAFEESLAERHVPAPELKVPRARVSDARQEDIEDSQQPPLTPNVSPTRANGTSGSPLKLFGSHDTYTKSRILRTLSSIEDNLGGQYSDESAVGGSKEEQGTNPEVNEAYIAASSPVKPQGHRGQELSKTQAKPRRLTQFGEGDLDRFEFSETFSHDSEPTSAEGDIGIADEGGSQFKFELDPSALEDGASIHRRMKVTTTNTTTRVVRTRRAVRKDSFSSDDEASQVHVSKRVENLETPRKQRDNDSQGKRLLRTPLKDPIPKRRRTLHKGDVAYPTGDTTIEGIQETHQSMQTVLGKKRKDARTGEEQKPADAEVMAARQVLKPRTASSSSKSSRGSKELGNVRIVIQGNHLSREEEEKIARVQAELDGFTNSSSFDGDPQMPMQNGDRKKSITTQDFLLDAKNVMVALREKLRGSQLGSVEESDPDKELDQDSIQESTMEPFSRPPSREGAPVARQPLQQQDPALLSHLQKYEDTNDVDIALTSSFKSLDLMKTMAKDFEGATQKINETMNRVTSRTYSLEEPFMSDPPNVQVTEAPELQRKRKHSTSSVPPEANEAKFDSQASNSSGPSTNRSVNTASSRTSETVKVIAPGTISHLIPEELAGMVYDREKGAWVKRKQVSRGSFMPSEDTDDDPFGDIPDLTVDETKELERIQEVEARKREEARVSGVQQYQRSTAPTSPQKTTPGGPSTSPTKSIHGYSDENYSTEPSKVTNFTSSAATAPGTRATSWGTEQGVPTKVETHIHEIRHETELYTRTVDGHEDEQIIEEAEEEISFHESRATPQAKPRRNVTISFSSPIASIIESSDYSQMADSESDDRGVATRKPSSSLWGGKKPLHSSMTRSMSRSASKSSRKQARVPQSFVARPVSRIDEHDEDSVHVDSSNRERSVSVVITPMPSRTTSHELSIISTPGPNFAPGELLELTPLSDFTMHQRDESFAFEVSMLHQREQRPHQARASNGNRSLSFTVKTLVQSITDVEAYEPFWEHMKQLKLKDRRLQSLHMLKEFCGGLEVLDASNNQITQLDGAPESIRQLSLSYNMLSDLTSWNMLRNLQYLDVSNNGLTSLDCFKDLVHLRSLRVDNNRIESLDGVLQLDGLITLRLRNNDIRSIDFSGSDLPRLTDLDLKGNRISSISGLHELSDLANLNLEDNDIEEFPVNIERPTWGLKYLKLSGNRIEHLDITNYPNLRVLYLDHNRINTITGLLRARHIDSLSLREQHPDSRLSPTIFNEAFEVRKLFLSGNLLTTFAPSVAYLNLQYLELANCGLNSLPADFGSKMPNIRILNLNFNALEDLTPLTTIARLKVLHLAGNRLDAVHDTCSVLSQLVGLNRLDLRNNPITLGFYPPACERRLSIQEHLTNTSNLANSKDETAKADPFVMEDANNKRDLAFERRLDMATGVKRRMYEILFVNECRSLKILDGLTLDRTRIARRDGVWCEMLKLNLIEMVEEGREFREKIEQEMSAAEIHKDYIAELRHERAVYQKRIDSVEKSVLSERWGAEDSFA